MGVIKCFARALILTGIRLSYTCIPCKPVSCRLWSRTRSSSRSWWSTPRTRTNSSATLLMPSASYWNSVSLSRSDGCRVQHQVSESLASCVLPAACIIGYCGSVFIRQRRNVFRVWIAVVLCPALAVCAPINLISCLVSQLVKQTPLCIPAQCWSSLQAPIGGLQEIWDSWNQCLTLSAQLPMDMSCTCSVLHVSQHHKNSGSSDHCMVWSPLRSAQPNCINRQCWHHAGDFGLTNSPSF